MDSRKEAGLRRRSDVLSARSGRRLLTNTVLVAGLVSISLSDSVPLDWFRCGAILPAGPSPAVLLRSLSAPSVSPELLLIWGHKNRLNLNTWTTVGAKKRQARSC